MVIEVKNLTKIYGKLYALDDISFAVDKGRTVGLLGPNGSGKTTTMKILMGMIEAQQGDIKVLGLDPFKEGDALRARCGVVTENAALYEDMTGRANLEFFAEVYYIENKKQKIDELIRLFNMESYIEQKVGGYSTGMKKRLAIARALINEPEILMLDEPTSGLDPESARSILNVIKELSSRDVTIFLCTHNLPEAQQVCNDYIFLDAGKLKEHGDLEGLENKYRKKQTVIITVGEGAEGEYDVKDGEIELEIKDKSDIPPIVKKIAEKYDIYGVSTKEYDLSELYFKIREEQ